MEAYNDNLDDDVYSIKDEVPHRFKPVSWAEFANAQIGEWIIKDVLPKAELAVIYGAPGSGKTFMALDAAMSIARGIEWANKRVKQGRVVYICAEGSGGFRKRLKAYEIHHKITASIIPFDVIADAPNFLMTMDSMALISQIGQASVIVIDTFSRTMPGGNENSGEDVGMAIAQCKAIHEATGAIIILIHHSGKDAERGARGWSGLLGACDTEIEITRIGDRRKGRISKQKDGDDDFEWGFKLDVVDLGMDDDGDMVTSCVYKPTNEIPIEAQKSNKVGPNEQRVLDVFKSMESTYVPLEDLIGEAIKGLIQDPQRRDTRRQHVVRAIQTLHEKNKILVVGDMVNWH